MSKFEVGDLVKATDAFNGWYNITPGSIYVIIKMPVFSPSDYHSAPVMVIDDYGKNYVLAPVTSYNYTSDLSTIVWLTKVE